LHCLLQLGAAFWELGQRVDAKYAYHRARTYDRLNVDGMDAAAFVLDEAELSRLAHELFLATAKRPEPWFVAALCYFRNNASDRSLTLLDEAIALDPRHAPSFQLRGDLLLASGKADQAVVAFFQANALRKDLASFVGLVSANLTARKFKEALHAAKDAVATLPGSARAVALIGQVLATSPEGKDKAKRAFAKALALDPSCAEAALQLVDLSDDDPDVCVDLLQRALAAGQSADLHAKLGSVYAQAKRYYEALKSYHTALSLDASHAEAQSGLESLEQLMQQQKPASSRMSTDNSEGGDLDDDLDDDDDDDDLDDDDDDDRSSGGRGHHHNLRRRPPSSGAGATTTTTTAAYI